MNTPKVLYQFPQCAGLSFRPSNGTEGDMFFDGFCFQCVHEQWSHTQNDAHRKCDIMSRSLLYDAKDPKYPREWVFNSEGWPVCTAWSKWDWNSEKGDEPPTPPEPEDPRQLLMPLDITDLFPCEDVVVFKTGIVEAEWLKELEHA